MHCQVSGPCREKKKSLLFHLAGAQLLLGGRMALRESPTPYPGSKGSDQAEPDSFLGDSTWMMAVSDHEGMRAT